MKMGLREANQKFAKAIKAVKSGKVIVLTERGNPIATIQPYPRVSTDQDAIAQLEDEGVLRPNPQAGVIREKWKPVPVKGLELSKALRELRDDE